MACRILVPPPGIKPISSALGAWSLNHQGSPWKICSRSKICSINYVSLHVLVPLSPCSSLPQRQYLAAGDPARGKGQEYCTIASHLAALIPTTSCFLFILPYSVLNIAQIRTCYSSAGNSLLSIPLRVNSPGPYHVCKVPCKWTLSAPIPSSFPLLLLQPSVLSADPQTSQRAPTFSLCTCPSP